MPGQSQRNHGVVVAVMDGRAPGDVGVVPLHRAVENGATVRTPGDGADGGVEVAAVLHDVAEVALHRHDDLARREEVEEARLDVQHPGGLRPRSRGRRADGAPDPGVEHDLPQLPRQPLRRGVEHRVPLLAGALGAVTVEEAGHEGQEAAALVQGVREVLVARPLTELLGEVLGGRP